MDRRRTDWVRAALARLGAASPEPTERWLRGAFNYFESGYRLRRYAATPPTVVQSKFGLFDLAIARVSAIRRPLYVEFGVYEGESLLYWASRLATQEAAFIGFDTFQGLPEGWTPEAPAGHFSTGGVPPTTSDSRVSFVVGRFEETLPTWVPPSHDQLVVNVDCDLYSSAICALRHVEKFIRPGDLLYFDEVHDCEHEGRALKEWNLESEVRMNLLGVTRTYAQALFEVRE